MKRSQELEGPEAHKVDAISQRKRRLVVIVVAVILLAIAVAITVAIMPFMKQLAVDDDFQADFVKWVSSQGVFGFLVLLTLQILQIVIAFIPGEIVQVVAGAMYGTWGGLGLCFLGCIIASAAVYALVARFGRDFVVTAIGEEKLAKFDFLNSSEKLDTIVFVLFLIPGIPKDVLTYIVPLTPMHMKTFLILSNVARIPGMIASTLVGSSIVDTNWVAIIIVFAIVAVIGGLGIWKHDAIMSWAKSHSHHTGGHNTGDNASSDKHHRH